MIMFWLLVRVVGAYPALSSLDQIDFNGVVLLLLSACLDQDATKPDCLLCWQAYLDAHRQTSVSWPRELHDIAAPLLPACLDLDATNPDCLCWQDLQPLKLTSTVRW